MMRSFFLTTYLMSIQRLLGYSWGFHPIPALRMAVVDECRRRGAKSLLMCDGATSASNLDLTHLKRKELLDAIDLYNTNKKSSWLKESTEEVQKKPKGFFGAETRGAQTIDINDEGRRIIALIEDLANYNPTEIPLQGFMGYKEVQKKWSEIDNQLCNHLTCVDSMICCCRS